MKVEQLLKQALFSVSTVPGRLRLVRHETGDVLRLSRIFTPVEIPGVGTASVLLRPSFEYHVRVFLL